MDREQARELVGSLFDECGPSLVRYAYRATGSRELADDLVQDAFAFFCRALLSDKLPENPRGWLLGVVRNLIEKQHRRRKSELLNRIEDLDALPGPVLGPIEREPGFDDLARLLSVLSKREREVLLLRVQSLKYREIAQHLEISAKAVATLLARAVGKLQTAARARADQQITVVRNQNVSRTLQ